MIRIAGPLWGWPELKLLLPRRGQDNLTRVLRPLLVASQRDFLPVANGRAAIYLALQACGVTTGSLVAVNALCCNSVLCPITALGAKPLYIDSEPGNFCLSPAVLDAALARNSVAAVIAAHFSGQRSNMCRLAEICRRRGVPLIDDAAYLSGLRVDGRLAGTEGLLGVWSFNAKLLFGHQGAILLGEADCIEKVRRQIADLLIPPMTRGEACRRYANNVARRLLGSRVPDFLSGQVPPADWRTRVGIDMPVPPGRRASDVQCVLMAQQLRRVEAIVRRVRRSAAEYAQNLAGSVFQTAELPYDGCFGRAIPLHWRDPAGRSQEQRADITWRLRQQLFRHGVQTTFYVPQWWWDEEDAWPEMPHCRDLWCRTLCVPNHPLMTAHDVRRVCRALQQAWQEVLQAPARETRWEPVVPMGAKPS